MFDRASPIPLYAQLRDMLRQQIRTGRYRPGDRLPTEKELMAEYGLSSSAVRQALLGLVQEGLVERTAGRGTFVRDQPVYDHHINLIASFAEQVAAQGYQPDIELVEFRFDRATDSVASALQVPPAAEVFRITRIQRTNGEPILVNTIFHPYEFGIRLQPHKDAMRQLYRQRFYREHLGVRMTSISRWFQAALANVEHAQRLHISVGAPVLLDHRIISDQTERPYEYSQAVWRGDRCRVHLRAIAGASAPDVIEMILTAPGKGAGQTNGTRAEVGSPP